MSSHPSWEPVDLTDVIAGDAEPPEPTICRTEGGFCLLYPGRTHILAGEPEAGKTWFAVNCVREQLDLGNVVVYIDYEDDATNLVSRLKQVGVTDQTLSALKYIRPESSLEGSQETLFGLLDSSSPTLVVIDGVTAAMGFEGLKILSNDEVREFMEQVLPGPIARRGPAVLMLDHVPKNPRASGRGAIGAQDKLGAVTGAAFRLDRIEPFAIGSTGRSRITLDKDRPSGIRKNFAGGDINLEVGQMVIDSGADGVVAVTIRVPDSRTPRAEDLSDVKEQVLQAMGEEVFRRRQDVYELVPARRQRLVRALNELVSEKRISDNPYRRL